MFGNRPTATGGTARIAIPFAVVLALAIIATVRDAPADVLAKIVPENDNYSTAMRIEPFLSPPGADSLPVDHTESTDGATLETGETAACGSIGATIWFVYHADRDVTIAVDTAGSSFDTILAVYRVDGIVPSPPGGSLASLACDDNAIGQQSKVTFPVLSGQVYYIQAGGGDGATGSLHLHADCDPPCGPKNDAVVDAINVDAWQMPYRDTRSTVAATLEPGEPAGCAGMGATAWYRIYTPQSVKLVATTEGSTFDTAIAAYRQGNTLLPSPPGGMTQIGCDDNALGRQSKLTLTTQPGDVMYVQAGGANGATGMLAFNIDCVPACPPPNDMFDTGWGFGLPFDTSVDTTGATLEPGEPRPCGQMSNTAWFRYWYAPSASHFTIDTLQSEVPAVVAVYAVPRDQQGTFANLQLVGCSDHTSSAPLRGSIEANREYAVQVGTRAGSPGTVQLHADCDPSPCPPFNDDVAFAYSFDAPWGLPSAYSYDARGATTEPGEPLGCGGMGKTSWFAFHNYRGGTLDFDTTDSDYDTALAVYEVPESQYVLDFATAHRIGCATSQNGVRAHVSWQPRAGYAYYVQVGGADGAGGNLFTSARCDGCPPPNDDLVNAQYIGPGSSVSADLSAGTLESGEPQPCGAMAASAWYTIAGASGGVILSSAGSQIPVVIAVYTVEGFSPPPGSLSIVACSRLDAGIATARFGANPERQYYIQLGAVDAASQANVVLTVSCDDCEQAGTGGGSPLAGGGVTGPDTGTGGYLPARR